MSYILEVKNVSKKFANGDSELHVLNNVSLNISDGEFICLLGPSGCGKSTLLRCIAGFENVDNGEIYLNGEKVKGPGLDRIMVFQEFTQLFPWKTVLQNVSFPLQESQKIPRKEAYQQALELIKMVGLSGFENSYPYQLSGGMKQRAAIARALVLHPKVLLMDEPFASLDAQTRTILQVELIKIWQKTGATILFVTHNIQEAIILGDRIAVFASQPGGIKAILDNNIPRPRIPNSQVFTNFWEECYSKIDVKRFGEESGVA